VVKLCHFILSGPVFFEIQYRKYWSKEITVSVCEEQKVALLWSRHETQLSHVDVFLQKDIIQGTLPGSRERERPKTLWLGNITERTNVYLETVLRTSDNRTEWKITLHREINPRVEDGFKTSACSHRPGRRLCSL